MAEVVIYSRKLCGYCSAAKSLLSSKGVEFTEHDGTFSPEIRAEMVERSNGKKTFPQIFINDISVGGFDELNVLEQSGQLDKLLFE
ncbi:MAG: glutaredoxin 3, partial [Rhizobiaceae bacterium]